MAIVLSIYPRTQSQNTSYQSSNVVLIVTMTKGYGVLAIQPNKDISTPFLDSFAGTEHKLQ